MKVTVTFPKGFDPQPRGQAATLYDCFLFYNELDLLEIRLRELDPVVDYFVLAESNETFRGQAKQLWFENNKCRFEPFLHKIVHIVTSDTAAAGKYHPVKVRKGNLPWTREGAQRNALIEGLRQARGQDWVVLSDVDEIPNARIVDRIARQTAYRRGCYVFEQDFFEVRLNWRPKMAMTWTGSRMIERRFLRTMQGLRRFKSAASPDSLVPWLDWRAQCCWDTRSLIFPQRIPNAGWHFSSIGTAEHIRNKFTSYSHWDHDMDQSFYELDKLRTRVAEGRLHGGEGSIVVPLSHLPACIGQNADKFKHLLDMEAHPHREWLPAGAPIAGDIALDRV
ncbi:MAG: hypothetical protein ACR2PI_12685 [Hyphomicrobiaceae bacterium]